MHLHRNDLKKVCWKKFVTEFTAQSSSFFCGTNEAAAANYSEIVFEVELCERVYRIRVKLDRSVDATWMERAREERQKENNNNNNTDRSDRVY